MQKGITPSYGNGVSVAVAAASSANVNFTAGNTVLKVMYVGTGVCFVEIGVGAQTATTADHPILNNQAEYICIPTNANNIAGIASSGSSGTLYVMPAEGIGFAGW